MSGIASGRLARSAVLVLALVAPACARGSTPEPGPPALELVPHEAQQFGYGPLPVGTYVAYGLSTGAVHATVRIVDIEPLAVSDNVEFVGARLAFYVCTACRKRPGTYGVRVQLGSTCGAEEPHNRALLPALGQELHPGDAPHFIMIGRIRAAGDASIKGAKVTYRVGNKRRTVETPVHSAFVDAASPLDGQSPCPPPARETWFDGASAKKDTVLLE